MARTVWLGVSTLGYPRGGGFLWTYLQLGAEPARGRLRRRLARARLGSPATGEGAPASGPLAPAARAVRARRVDRSLVVATGRAAARRRRVRPARRRRRGGSVAQHGLREVRQGSTALPPHRAARHRPWFRPGLGERRLLRPLRLQRVLHRRGDGGQDAGALPDPRLRMAPRAAAGRARLVAGHADAPGRAVHHGVALAQLQGVVHVRRRVVRQRQAHGVPARARPPRAHPPAPRARARTSGRRRPPAQAGRGRREGGARGARLARRPLPDRRLQPRGLPALRPVVEGRVQRRQTVLRPSPERLDHDRTVCYLAGGKAAVVE